MGTITAGAILDKVSSQLLDKVNAEFSRTELLGWLNDGQREVSRIDPTANAAVANVTCVAGTRQSIPADGWLLLDVYRNMGSSGTTPGRSVRVTSMKLLDSFDPDWHTATSTNEPYHYIFDPNDETAFWVYPPSDGTSKLQVNYAKVPAAISSEATAIELSDLYANALVDYVLYRAVEKASADQPVSPAAGVYWAAFSNAVSGKVQVQGELDPNQSLAPRQPNTQAAES